MDLDWASVPPLLTVLMGPLLAATAGTWAVAQWGLNRLGERIDSRFDAVDSRFDAVDSRFDAVDARFDAVDHRFDAVNIRIDAVDKRCDGIDNRISELRTDVRTLAHRIDQLHQ